MAQRLLRTSVLGVLTFDLLLGGGPVRADFAHTDPSASLVDPLGTSPSQASQQFELRSAIAFTSTRDNTAEMYLMLTKQDGTPDPTQTRRLTNNTSGEGFAALSPDGMKIVFDSERLTHLINSSDLFVMNVDDSDELQHPIPDNKQRRLTRGSSATWAPVSAGNATSKYIAFHASKSGTGGPSKVYPGAPTVDSDIFVVNVDDCLKVIELNGVDDCREIAGGHVKNITNNGNATIDDDPDWHPDGTKIVFVRHAPTLDRVFSPDAEIWVMNPDGSGQVQLTFNSDPHRPASEWIEERGPSWSPDGKRIVYACRKGAEPPPAGNRFEICVMNSDGSGQTQLTSDTTNVPNFTPTWSPDGTRIVYHSRYNPFTQLRLITFNPDGTVGHDKLTDPPGLNLLANWGKVRVHVKAPTVTQPARAPAAAPVPKR